MKYKSKRRLRHILTINSKFCFLGKERRVQSPALSLEVTGRPQVLLNNSTRTQEFVKGSDAVVKALFCSDPKYRKVSWEWNGLNLTEGNAAKSSCQV